VKGSGTKIRRAQLLELAGAGGISTPWCRACPLSCFVAAFPKKSAADVAQARIEIVVFGGEDRLEKIVADLMPHCGWLAEAGSKRWGTIRG